MPTNPPIVARRRSLGVGVESTKGTAATVTTVMAATNVYDAKMVPVDLLGDGKRELHLNSSGTPPRVPGARKGKLTFKTELCFGDVTDTLLSGCGFEVAAHVATPTTDISAQKTLTFKLWEGGRVKTMYGCSGSFTLENGGTGQRVVVSWEFQGIWGGTADAAMPSDSMASYKPFTAKGATLTVGGSGIAPIDTFSLKSGSDTQMSENITKATGIGYFYAGDIQPTLSLDPEARLVVAYDTFGKLLAGTAEAISLTIVDADSHSFVIAAPKAQRIDVDTDERGKKAIDKTEFELHIDAGDDQIEITTQ